MEEEEIEVPVTKEPEKEAAKMETDEAPADGAPPSSDETDVNMQDAKASADAPGSENGVPESGEKTAEMETDAKVVFIIAWDDNREFFWTSPMILS